MAISITISSWVVVSLFSLSKSATSTLLVVSEISLLFFGLLLVVGSLGEIAKTAKWKVYTTLSGWRAYSKIAIILLIVGVAGELIADGFIFAFSSHLQTIADGEFAALNKEAAYAREVAGKAVQRGEELKAENLSLEALLQPRFLSIQQQHDIGVSLLTFEGHKVVVKVASMTDPESNNLGLQIKASLEAAKLDVRFESTSPNGRQYSPITETGVQVNWPPSQRAFGSKVKWALSTIGQIKLCEPKGTTQLAATDPVLVTVYPKPFDVLKSK